LPLEDISMLCNSVDVQWKTWLLDTNLNQIAFDMILKLIFVKKSLMITKGNYQKPLSY